ncbi:hypothetical protein BCR42DRAFT_365072 [Absidia repens]|uniref:Uncharacterized protein n=1 Tax=Absidia repens TaxID=90262 RepID=A0A1X2IXG1_9FUNG|nr:hypothetical protein BCR42DRAFT_365072 [Absidia repens]
MPRFYPIVSSLVRPQPCQQAIGRSCLRPLFAAHRYFSTSSQHRVHHYTRTNKSTNSTNDYQYDQRYQYYEQVTENTVLSSFPRPNLNPTLHYTLFTTSCDTSSNSNASKKKCKHCHGPHMTENCPC